MKISRVTILTLGVADLGKATEFYRIVLGTPPNTSSDGITFIIEDFRPLLIVELV
jgi:uncharacterized protein